MNISGLSIIGSSCSLSAKRDNFCEKNKPAETDTSANKLTSIKNLYYYYYRKKRQGCKGENRYFLKISTFFHWQSKKSWNKKKELPPNGNSLLY